MTFNMHTQDLLLSALFGNLDKDACLVDKSVTLEIDRNYCALTPVFSARDGRRGIKPAHISNFILFCFLTTFWFQKSHL